MQAFKIHEQIVGDYKNYLKSFTLIKDERIKKEVNLAFSAGKFLPDPLIQFNPSYLLGESLDDLITGKIIHPDLKRIFGNYNLYAHQVEAIKKGVNGQNFVVTSGTGSGKSLTYLASIFNSILNKPNKQGIKAIIVYPMNALINSQEEEIKKYEINYLKSFIPAGAIPDEKGKTFDEIIGQLRKLTDKRFLTYAKYTGQTKQQQREILEGTTPDIILTNYMMLELIMTRNNEKWIRDSIGKSLEFLVFDELHTYRGRQGADVSMLIRRIKSICKNELVCIGTSATMASGGTLKDRLEAIAAVGRQIFDYPFSTESIITEKLSNCTSALTKELSAFELQEAIEKKINFSARAEEFIQNKIAIWLENNVALKRNEIGKLERGEPITLLETANRLSKDSGEDVEDCKRALLDLLQWSEQLNIEGSKKHPRKSYLPFKIHQFISQTGNVYVTLDEKSKRKISLDTGKYVKVGAEDKQIFPVLFSRYSGYDFICVRKNEGKLTPRYPDDLPTRLTKDDLIVEDDSGKSRRPVEEDDFPDGYIIIPEDGDEIWSEEDEDLLPDSWLNKKKSGGKFDNYYEHRLPKRIYFDTDGNFSHKPEYPIKGWFIAARMILDPTSGIVFDLKTNENTKLMRLGNEGRSTATTITSFSIIKALNFANTPINNQKLLSFTDNRQDASLQAGHFNDFLMLGRLRSAIYHALKDAPDNTLSLDNISDTVFKKLNLREDEYAREPSADPGWPDLENERAVKDYILIRILYDLKRGWRYNTPNLEQCGLLEIAYNRLSEFAAKDEFFKDLELFESLDAGKREEYILQILNFFRTSYAFEYYKLLDKREETQERLKNKLHEEKLWSLDLDEYIDTPYNMLPKSIGDAKNRAYTASIGPMSYLGKYLRRLLKQHGLSEKKGDELSQFIEEVCKVLVRGHFLKSELVQGKKGESIGFRLRIDNVRWKLGNGKDVLPDNVRIASTRAIKPSPNDFFKKFYQQDFAAYKRPLIGREHTGQLNNDDRVSREEDFRKGEIASLFCSPTMELGIDIAELNVVHMRNVPPNPSNYAQRSGRAGRSGQAALIFTYCSNGSPHDRNYFKDSRKMVSGNVVAPKIDLTNRELLLSHFNSFILMELGLSDLQSSVNDVLNVSSLPELPLKDTVSSHIEDQVNRYSLKWVTDFLKIIEAVEGVKSGNWYSEELLTLHANSFKKRFDECFNRWRVLYRAANKMVEMARAVIDDPTIANDNPRKSEAKREESIGKKQRELLLNNNNYSFGSESEFYVYRYMASEGFLPGYGFTRLPIRAFLGYRHRDKGEYVSRPRFVALKEFGPNNLIYHNGSKYRMTRMLLPQADVLKQTLRISKQTGYAFLNEEGKGMNNDPINGNELKGQDNVAIWNNVVGLEESDAKPQERISCEEEERMSTGFDCVNRLS